MVELFDTTFRHWKWFSGSTTIYTPSRIKCAAGSIGAGLLDNLLGAFASLYHNGLPKRRVFNRRST
jgi:superfamily II helicase